MIDNDGYLILTMTDGTTINAGLVRDTSAVANKEANDSATAKSLCDSGCWSFRCIFAMEHCNACTLHHHEKKAHNFPQMIQYKQ